MAVVNASVFKSKLTIFWDTLIQKICCWIMKITNSSGHLTDIMAKKDPLDVVPGLEGQLLGFVNNAAPHIMRPAKTKKQPVENLLSQIGKTPDGRFKKCNYLINCYILHLSIEMLHVASTSFPRHLNNNGSWGRSKISVLE